jgi:predicted DNA-binding protein with PD1-like motif
VAILINGLVIKPTIATSKMEHRKSTDMLSDNVKIHAFRLKPGEDLKAGIERVVQQEKIEAGWIMTAVGSLVQTAIRYANQPVTDSLSGHIDIVSMTGTVSINGSHLHISVSDSTGNTIGGHLMPGNVVYTTAELVIALLLGCLPVWTLLHHLICKICCE